MAKELTVLLSHYDKDLVLKMNEDQSIYELFKNVEIETGVSIAEQDLIFHGGYLSPSKNAKLKSLVKTTDSRRPILHIILSEKESPMNDSVSLWPPRKSVQKTECHVEAQTQGLGHTQQAPLESDSEAEEQEIQNPVIKDLISQGDSIEADAIYLRLPHQDALQATTLPSTMTRQQLLLLSDRALKLTIQWDALSLASEPPTSLLRKIRQENVRRLLNICDVVDSILKRLEDPTVT